MIQSRAIPQPSLDTLLAAVAEAGDVDAWRALVGRITPCLYRLARGLTAWRVLGAQTIVEHAWRAAIRIPGAMDDGATLRRVLIGQVVDRALTLGDSPRDLPENEPAERIAAMRAVALLPHPARAVLVLADVGGISLTESAEYLRLPLVRLKTELWHARMAVDTLRGAGPGNDPQLPALSVMDASSNGGAAPSADTAIADPSSGTGSTEGTGVAPIWLETPPEGLVDRLAHDLHDRRQRRRLSPRMRHLKLPVLGALLAAVLTAASVLIWQEAPRLVRGLDAASAPYSTVAPPVASERDGAAPATRSVTPSPAPGPSRVARRSVGNGTNQLPARSPRGVPPRRL